MLREVSSRRPNLGNRVPNEAENTDSVKRVQLDAQGRKCGLRIHEFVICLY
jgi:hypothetical protein